MEIGFVGLGRMGSRMVLKLLDEGEKPVVLNRSFEPTRKLAKKGAVPSYSLQEMVDKLPKRKVIWLMIPAGKPIDSTLKELVPLLKKGDIIIDGGNSYFKDSQARAKELAKRGIHYLDCGTSGGLESARNGACLMLGGNKSACDRVVPTLRKMAAPKAFARVGGSGAGHYVKGMHNGIEYGMMAAIAEGIQGIKQNEKKFGIDMKKVLQVYTHDSIIESRLVGWLYRSFMTKGYLDSISGSVPAGETTAEMKKLKKMHDLPVLGTALRMRAATQKKPSLAGQYTAAMRNQFGGHAVKRKK